MRYLHITRGPIAEPQPLWPLSEFNLEEWESYIESEEQSVPPPTIIDLPPPILFVQVPIATTTRARSVSPASTIEESTAGEPRAVDGNRRWNKNANVIGRKGQAHLDRQDFPRALRELAKLILAWTFLTWSGAIAKQDVEAMERSFQATSPSKAFACRDPFLIYFVYPSGLHHVFPLPWC